MRNLDETDLRILELLAEDARRPFSDISAEVDLSAPAVSDRIDRLREEGVIRRFTVDLDQSTLSGGTPVLVRLAVRPAFVDDVRDTLRDAEPVEHLFVSADGDVTFHARLGSDSIRAELHELLDLSTVRDYEVSLVESAEWTPTVNGTGFALECAECGNTVTSEGERARIGGTLYHFCCSSCLGRFEDRYDRLEAGAQASEN
ncbi:AsnC family transcriptional regulator [Haloferax mediterranei ATCC 33500]|uniref:ArsR family transcriptional regulator n=1 Tax=Haloferax mediterranei (strain ATCC 33500 / DSM 1411 / JCM 8866 / NBRC 14739 / NCIMB 2177 / R-4) TaxID=523841 RepID=I3R5L6_HALMT|nr:AsnC family transcriptional regulator [Haloferax mediterranei]AFK19526.1 Lrp/AsnC family transcription regulator [Haloferax mediterranei ATCC 33500]AHZ22922.1 ArsR family transcriptional regulator [Haloferax mediterranei ATCC 33500]ELZ99847.1 Lrp/AsnC family transcription regulator [Haloferax mediterranei ATCC 33500]MDX5987732.1 AsnC family transcriptional regulator [Haloferax mediterranei ATCC 33500]QCQ74211.1 AsnC family transcriptional regulator [Haloferax mediterranei ATCC 33500]